jgi:DNA-binding MarR family transcriptional regulator
MLIAAPLLSRTTMNRAVDAPRRAFTARQGQFLAFTYTYTLVNGRPPAEADMMRFFRLTPPSVHQMVLTLEKAGLILKLEQLGLISRQPGVPRSIVVLLDRSALPPLEPSGAQPVKTSVQRY